MGSTSAVPSERRVCHHRSHDSASCVSITCFPVLTLGLSSGTGKPLKKARLLFQVSHALPKAMCRLLQAEVIRRSATARGAL